MSGGEKDFGDAGGDARVFMSRAVMIAVISDSGIVITVGFKEPELEPIPGSSAGNRSFVGSAPLIKGEQAWDEQERLLILHA